MAAIFAKIEKFMHEAEPNNTYHAYRVKKDPLRIVIFETLPSKEALDRHMKETLPAAKKKLPIDKALIGTSLEYEILLPVAR